MKKSRAEPNADFRDSPITSYTNQSTAFCHMINPSSS